MKNLPGYVLAEKDLEIRKAIKNAMAFEASKYLTICEQLRFIYDIVLKIDNKEIRNDLTEKLIDAYSMGKKMNARLEHYKREYNKDKTGSAGRNLILLNLTKEREKIRKSRI